MPVLRPNFLILLLPILLIRLSKLVVTLTSLSLISFGCQNRPKNQIQSSTVYWIDTDIGFDPDDLMALLISTNLLGDKIVGVSTNLFSPHEKAKITRTVLDAKSLRNIPVHSGLGTSSANLKEFKKDYPYWPPQFGDPYKLQGKSAKDFFGHQSFKRKKFSSTVAYEALASAIRKHSGNIVVIALGPLTNVAKTLEAYPELSSGIQKLVVMGGWKEDKKGNILRPGYNTLMDLSASKEVFTNKQLRVDLVTTNIIAENNQRLEAQEFQVIGSMDTPLARMLFADLKNWMKEIENKDGRLWLYDPVALILAVDEKWIERTRLVKIQLRDVSGAHMKNELASKLISVDKGSGHIREIVTIKQPKVLRSFLVSILKKSIE